MERETPRADRRLAILSISVTVVLCVFILYQREYLDEIRTWGYVGCFLVNVIASGTFVVPGTGAILTFTLGGVLNPAIVGVVAGLGEATGAVGAYLTGYGGRGILINGRLQEKFSGLMQRHGSKAMFLMAALVNPIYYPFAVWMGVLQVRVGRFFFYTLLGRTFKNMLLAYLGYFGMRTVLQWLGMNV
ncbi:MAG: VTT domain-containing protein [Chloroflexota bacterium]